MSGDTERPVSGRNRTTATAYVLEISKEFIGASKWYGLKAAAGVFLLCHAVLLLGVLVRSVRGPSVGQWIGMSVAFFLGALLLYVLLRYCLRHSLVLISRTALMYIAGMTAFSLKLSGESALLVRKDSSGQYWLLSTTLKKRKKLKLRVAAFPHLGEFVREHCQNAVIEDH